MPSPEQISEAVLAFINADTWTESQRIVEAQQALLLTDDADQYFDVLLQQYAGDENATRTLTQHRTLLRRCREVGIDAAFAEMTTQQPGPEIDPALLARLQQVQTPEELQRLVEEHPELLPVLEQIAQQAAQQHPQPQQPSGLPVPSHFRERLQQAQAAEQRYLQRNDVAALDVAVAAWEDILNDATFAAAPERFRLAVMNDASKTLYYRYMARGNAADLDAAIAHAQAAVAATPPDSPDLPGRRNNLGNSLSARYGCTGQVADLDAAIAHAQAAVAATPPDSPHYAAMRNNLGRFLSERYGRSGQVADLDAAIAHAQAAVAATPPDSPDYAMYRNNLGMSACAL
jgi:tetratricopeptide (TPR) repeat protein